MDFGELFAKYLPHLSYKWTSCWATFQEITFYSSTRTSVDSTSVDCWWCIARPGQEKTNKSHLTTRWSGDVMKRPGHKNFNAVSHNRSRPEVLFLNLTWQSRGQISWVLLQLLLFAFSNRKFRTREMICYILAMGKQHLGPHVIVRYGN